MCAAFFRIAAALFFLLSAALPGVFWGQGVQPSDYSGSVSSSVGNVTTGWFWSGRNGGVKLSWDITRNGSNYNYIYNITNSSGGALATQLNTFVLGVGTAVTPQNVSSLIVNPSPGISAGPVTFSRYGPGGYNPGMPGSMYGVSFNVSGNTATVSFSSSLAPIWGNFYAGGNSYYYGSNAHNNFHNNYFSGYAYNSGFSTNPPQNSTNYTQWIPTPGAEIPEPGVWISLLSTFLMAFIVKTGLHLKKQRKKI